MKHILSCGMGQNSVSLAIWLINNNKPLDLIIFCDTGAEMPETYNYIKEFSDYCKSKNKEFVVIQSDLGGIYEFCYGKELIPTRQFRWCTHKFKVIPYNNYVKKLFGKEEIYTYIGIGSDEEHRKDSFKNKETKTLKYLFPFVDEVKIGRKESVEMIQKEGLNVPVKSGCYMCPFQPKTSWINLHNKHFDLFKKSMKLERNCSSYPKITLMGKTKLFNLRKIIKEQKTLNQFFKKKEGVEIEQCNFCLI